MKHIWKFLVWLADIVFGIAVIVAFLLIVSMIFFPRDNVLLAFGKWLAYGPLSLF